ncbi:MAG: hypothetical protein RLY16_1032, partial [Bacteroidota bacterium]
MARPETFTYRILTTISLLMLSVISSAQVQFIENKGQWDAGFQFKSDVPSGAFFLHNNGFTVLQNNPDDMDALQLKMHGHSSKEGKEEYVLNNNPITIRSHAYRVNFIGASVKAIASPDKILPTY